ncbi:MAG: hypothetical protein COA97_06110 [Flavobacteriales bacterium]|nr:MAG: hypothetical protein COA97_06110 [Flavobacteriales bacterium]
MYKVKGLKATLSNKISFKQQMLKHQYIPNKTVIACHPELVEGSNPQFHFTYCGFSPYHTMRKRPIL